jgi:hypothetical protein
MAVHAVVVIEKAVADENLGFWKIRTERGDLRLRLRRKLGRSDRCRDGGQYDEQRCNILGTSSLPVRFCFAVP